MRNGFWYSYFKENRQHVVSFGGVQTSIADELKKQVAVVNASEVINTTSDVIQVTGDVIIAQ